MRLSDAVDVYVGDVARRCAPRTKKKYSQLLEYFVSHLGENYPVEQVTVHDCLAFLARWNDSAPKTQALGHTVLSQMFKFLTSIDVMTAGNPMLKIAPPKVPAPEDRNIKTITREDVQKMIGVCETWTEKLTVGLLAYMGVRRAAANNLRWKDVDLELGYIRFDEKGRKSIRKPIPKPLLDLLSAYRDVIEVREPVDRSISTATEWLAHNLSSGQEDYVIPSEGETRRDIRDDRFIWRVVKRVGRRAGVDTHCHAFRSAFAVFYLESNEGHLEGLQPLMGHKHLATTQGYLRRLDRAQAMEKVRTLDWGVSLEQPVVSKTIGGGSIPSTPATSKGVSLTPGENNKTSRGKSPATALAKQISPGVSKMLCKDCDAMEAVQYGRCHECNLERNLERKRDYMRRVNEADGQELSRPSKQLRGKDSNLDYHESKKASARTANSRAGRRKRRTT